MSRFLDQFLITMPETQQKKLKELLDVRRQQGVIRSTKELEHELERLWRNIEKQDGKPIFQGREQLERIDSSTHNANMEELYFDLLSLFEASNSIDRLIGDNHQLARSLLSSMHQKIQTLKAQIERYKLIAKNTDAFTQNIYEEFNAPLYLETDESVLKTLRKDRFGNVLSSNFNAEVIGGSLQLAGVEAIDQLQTKNGRQLADIKVLNQTGYPSQNPGHEIEKAIDGSLETFWAESVLVDEPITQNIDNLWSNVYQDIPKSGALCEIEITLNGVNTVSNVEFVPFCRYPLEVVAIYGYETEKKVGNVYELISPNHENPYQRSQKSVNKMVFQFPSVDVSKLVILIRQENYVKENYLLKESDKQNMELWHKLSSDPGLIEDYKDPNETIEEFNRKNEITGWTTYLEKLKQWAEEVNKPDIIEAAERAMETIRLGDYKNPILLKLQALNPNKQEEINQDSVLSQGWGAVNKISYVYGAYHISVYGRKYRGQSIAITKPLPISSNTIRLSLETSEKQHDQLDYHVLEESELTSNTHRTTDIEYYIAYKKNPSVNDWIPILPTQYRYVKGELLVGDTIKSNPPEFEEIERKGNHLIVYSFRFPVVSDKTVVLRRNGVVMDPSTYVISNDGRKIGIYAKYFTSASIYTVDYKPADSAWYIDLRNTEDIEPTPYIDDNGETGEYFSSADHDNSITLKHKPYLFRNQIFTYNEDENFYEQKAKSLNPEYPIIVRVNGEEYKNITDYTTNSYDVERLKENEGKTFAQIGNRIIFGRPTDGSPITNITVDYLYIATNIRLKMILRRNNNEDESITPALYNYTIRCQTIDQEE